MFTRRVDEEGWAQFLTNPTMTEKQQIIEAVEEEIQRWKEGAKELDRIGGLEAERGQMTNARRLSTKSGTYRALARDMELVLRQFKSD